MVIDVVTLGVGLSLTLFYIWYRGNNPGDNSALIDLWSNIATEVIGVCLSVRIIDALTQRREVHHSIRQELVGNLIYFLEIAQRLIPYFDEWRIQDLENELMWFEKRFTKRQCHLSGDEREAVTQAISEGRIIIVKAKQCVALRQAIDDLQLKIKRTVDNINTEDDVTQIYLHEVKWYRKMEEEYRILNSRARYGLTFLDSPFPKIELEQMGFPPILISLFEEYFDIIKNFVNLRFEIDGLVVKLERAILEIRSNVFEESDPD